MADGTGSTAVGHNTNATKVGSVAVGAYTNATGDNSSAYGGGSTASGAGSTSVGYQSKATAARTSAFGRFSNASAYAGTALGNESTASGVGSLAVGSSSKATKANSVALGNTSVVTEEEVVSLGHKASDAKDDKGNTYGSDLTRRVINMSDGIDDSDGATVRQLKQAKTAVTVGGQEATYEDAAYGGNLILKKTQNEDGADVYDVSLNDTIHVKTVVGDQIVSGDASGQGLYFNADKTNTIIGDTTVKGDLGTQGKLTALEGVEAAGLSIAADSEGNHVISPVDGNSTVIVSGVTMKDGDITADSGTIGGVTMKDGKITANSATIGKVSIAEDGKISGVADGVDTYDAVNVGQLNKAVTDTLTAAAANDAKVLEAAVANDQLILDTATKYIDKAQATADDAKANADALRQEMNGSDGALTLLNGATDEESGNASVEAGINKNTEMIAGSDGKLDFSGTNYIKDDENLEAAAITLDGQIKKTDDKVGDTQYSSTNYVTSGDNLTDAVSALDSQVKTNENGIAENKSSIETINKNLGDGSFTNGAATYTDAINANTDGILQNSISIHELGREIDSVGAISAALAGLHPFDYDGSESKWQMSAAVGSYDGSNALAMGGFYHVNEDVMLSGGVSTILKGERKTAGNIGVTFRVGQSGKKAAAADTSELAAKNQALEEKVAAQAADLAEQKAKLEELEAKLAELAAK